MKCAYCNEERVGTREHIISSSVLDLFPECYITFDFKRKVVHQADSVIKDTCGECNSNLSYIDYYAKKLISDNFIDKFEKDDEIKFIYNYSLLQKVLLKYSYNSMRAYKKDTAFFDEKVIKYLKDKCNVKPLDNVVILAGLAVNTTPMHDYMFNNLKLRWSENPMMFSNSIIENIDYITGEIRIRENNKAQEFESLAFTYLFRFNSGQFLLICFDENITKEMLKDNNIILKYQYPYEILDENGKSTLTRCTSEATYHSENLIDTTWGQGMFDEISYMRGTFSKKSKKVMEAINKEWLKEENKLSNKHKR